MIRLTLGAIAIELTKFRSNSVPRSQPNIAQITYSANGTPLADGTAYEAPFQWDISAIVNAEQRLDLIKIYQRSLNESEDILLEDYIEPYVEYGAQSRAAAAGQTPTIADGYTTYFAKFSVRFDGSPEWERLGHIWGVSLVLKESALVAV